MSMLGEDHPYDFIRGSLALVRNRITLDFLFVEVSRLQEFFSFIAGMDSVLSFPCFVDSWGLPDLVPSV